MPTKPSLRLPGANIAFYPSYPAYATCFVSITYLASQYHIPFLPFASRFIPRTTCLFNTRFEVKEKKGVFLVTTKNVNVPVECVYSVNTH